MAGGPNMSRVVVRTGRGRRLRVVEGGGEDGGSGPVLAEGSRGGWWGGGVVGGWGGGGVVGEAGGR